MDGPRYVALLDRLVDAAGAAALAARRTGAGGRRAARAGAGPWRKLRKAVEALGADPPDADLHRVRILAKRTRYAAEAAAPRSGKPAAAFAAAVADLQEVLGDHQDAVVAEAWLRERGRGAPTCRPAGGRRAHRRRRVEAARRRAWPARGGKARKRPACGSS